MRHEHRALRVALVTTSYPRGDGDPSGHFVEAQARALARSGHDVHVVAPGGSPLAPPERRGDVTVHRAGGGSLFTWPGAAARAREAPWRLAALAPFAAGVAHRMRGLGHVDRTIAHFIVPTAWPLLAGHPAPLEVHAHGADVRFLLGAPASLRRHVVGALSSRGARFTFAARASLDALAAALPSELGAVLREASQVSPPALDLPDVAASGVLRRASLRLVEGERLAVVACRLVASKRVELAIDAVLRSRDGLRLVILGDGPERISLERRAGPGARALFLGTVDRDEALSWIAAADVLVHPSGVEAAPTVVREARALGTPVVACEAGDVAAWAEADTGIVLAAPTGAAIARAALMTRSARRPLDRLRCDD